MSRYLLSRDNMTYNISLMSGGRVLSFDCNGNCLGFVQMTGDMLKSPREVDIISVLQYKDGCEVAFNINNTLETVHSKRMVADIVDLIANTTKYISSGVRKGKTYKGVPWQQFIFMCPVCTINVGAVKAGL